MMSTPAYLAKNNALYDTTVYISVGPVILATYLCMHYLDTGLAVLVRNLLFANRGWSRYASAIPDVLLLLVVFITVTATFLYRSRVAGDRIDSSAVMYKMLALAAPLAFLTKTAFKYVFGRITTREWLLVPQDSGFHWFDGGEQFVGFPSGHMLVITAIVAVLWRFQPRYRPAYLTMVVLLAVALVATNYHFVSDVIAGSYAGLVVEVCLFRKVALPLMHAAPARQPTL